MANPRSGHTHWGDRSPNSLSLKCNLFIRRTSLGDVTPTRSSYTDPLTAASPMSGWSESQSEFSRQSSEYRPKTMVQNLLVGLFGNLRQRMKIASRNAPSIVESQYSFQSDTATVRTASVAQSQHSRRSQASATSWRHQGRIQSYTVHVVLL
jgi:hypothetical protein